MIMAAHRVRAIGKSLWAPSAREPVVARESCFPCEGGRAVDVGCILFDMFETDFRMGR